MLGYWQTWCQGKIDNNLISLEESYAKILRAGVRQSREMALADKQLQIGLAILSVFG
jgi:hypothetical protein